MCGRGQRISDGTSRTGGCVIICDKLADEIGGLLKIEIASVRANLLPMVILWGLAGAAVAAYYLAPGVPGL